MSSDERLVYDVLKGDIDKFEELVTRYEKKIYSLAFRMTGNHEDASDAAQEAFLKAYKSLGSFGGRAQFSTWLYRIAINVCYDMLRKRKRQPILSLDNQIETEDGHLEVQVAGGEDDPSEQVSRKELMNVLANAINQLPPEQRVVVILRDVKQLSYEEIGKILALPLGTVKSRLNRARKAIREIMQDNKELLPYALRLNK